MLVRSAHFGSSMVLLGLTRCVLHACRLENSTLAVLQSGKKSLLTPDIGGTGTTATFTDAVIKQLEQKFKGRYY